MMQSIQAPTTTPNTTPTKTANTIPFWISFPAPGDVGAPDSRWAPVNIKSNIVPLEVIFSNKVKIIILNKGAALLTWIILIRSLVCFSFLSHSIYCLIFKLQYTWFQLLIPRIIVIERNHKTSVRVTKLVSFGDSSDYIENYIKTMPS